MRITSQTMKSTVRSVGGMAPAGVWSGPVCVPRAVNSLTSAQFRRAHALGKAIRLILVRLPADVVIPRATSALGERSVDFAAHGRALAALLCDCGPSSASPACLSTT
jgi:hypothetical protein